ncbi:hypothetical protein ACFQ0I_13025 [Mariniflexile aquimaris]|uniref:PD-(D/E)XK nuclease superfamily protein n=1 Tax=Mariniflexile aquimaris TaxID=881009 RepID=A0ABW3BW46_9FLAO
MDWKAYFEMMKDWKKLPAYKAEPRIDSLIGYFLEPILADFLKEKIEGVIPELPIRLGTVQPKLENTKYAERSYKVDFFAVGKNGTNYLIEFKTDTNSRRTKQDEYLNNSKQLGTANIINGILKISNVSTYITKYNHLKSKLQQVGLLDADNKYNGKNKELEIIYIQPVNHNNENLVIDFNWIADWLEKNNKKDSFETELSNALRIWAND